MLYKMIEPLVDGETVVQFLAVHAVKWQPEWGAPQVGFCEAGDGKLAACEDALATHKELRRKCGQALAKCREELTARKADLEALKKLEAMHRRDQEGAHRLTLTKLAAAEARERAILEWMGDEWHEEGVDSLVCYACDAYKDDGHNDDCPWFILGRSSS